MSAIPLRRLEGKYEILEKIREGGMGAIYKVRHRLLDEVRVVKLMRPQLSDNPELRTRFLREAQVAIKLRHPNIAQLYDFTTDEDGTAVIVMEFISGKTLEEILRVSGPPPLGLTLEIAHQSLRALAYLHGKGFIHRDISPDNLMLTEDPDGRPQIKMIDLGIAKILGGKDTHLTKTGSFLGKVRYAAPEQFGVETGAAADARSDIYSFGVVLYELLTGVHPITGTDTSSFIAGQLFRAPLSFDESDPRGRVPPGLRAAVLTALAKQPGERHAGARELAGELARFRVPGDLAAEDWKQLLVPTEGGAAPHTEPGTTQDRLDDYFILEPTPLPVKPSSAAGGRTLAAVPEATVPMRRAAAAPAALVSPPGAPRRAVSVRTVILGSALALAVRVGGVWWWRGRTGPKAAPAASPPPVAVQAPAPDGLLKVDALPWGKVIAILDAQGRPLSLPDPAETPLVLTLPAGRYTVRLENPGFPQTITLHAEVPAGLEAPAQRVAGEFRRVDVDEYLKEVGL